MLTFNAVFHIRTVVSMSHENDLSTMWLKLFVIFVIFLLGFRNRTLRFAKLGKYPASLFVIDVN